MARWEAIAAATISCGVLTPNLFDMVKLKLCDAHLGHQGQARETVVWLAHPYVDNGRQRHDQTGKWLLDLEIADLKLNEPFTDILVFLVHDILNTKFACPSRTSNLHTRGEKDPEPQYFERAKAYKQNDLFRQLSPHVLVKLESMFGVEFVEESYVLAYGNPHNSCVEE